MLETNTKKSYRRGRLLYEGRSKRVYETNDPEFVFLEFKAEFVPKGANGGSTEPRKPSCAAEVAEHIFQYLQSFRIPNHFCGRIDGTTLLVKKMEMIPIAVIVRNIASGMLCQRYHLPEGRELEFPIVELMYRNHPLDNPMVNESHILAFGVSTPEEIRTMVRIATKTNAVLRSFMERRRFRLVDLWIEFGRQNGEVLIGDALFADTMRILDMDSNEIFDGSIYRLGIGDYRDTYISLYKRLTT